MGTIDILLKLLFVVEAGANLADVVQQVVNLKATGASDEDVSKWLVEKRKEVISQL